MSVALAGCQSVRSPSPVVTIVTAGALSDADALLEFHLRATPIPTADLKVNVEISVAPPGCTMLVTEAVTAVTIAAGAEQATLLVAVSGIAADAGDCTVTATVAEGDGYRVAAAQQATASVTHAPDLPEPQVPVVTIRARHSSVTEGDRVEFILTASNSESPLQVNVRWSDPGSYLSGTPPQTVDLLASGEGTLSANTDDDGVDEPHGRVTVTVERGTGYTVGIPKTAHIAVNDNDTAHDDNDAEQQVVTISTPNDSITEGETAVFIVSRTQAHAQEVVFFWEELGEFHDAFGPLLLIWEVVGKQHRLEFVTNDDAAPEPDGSITIEVRWRGPSYGYTVGEPSSATVYIADND